jgi:hypothetical protein
MDEEIETIARVQKLAQMQGSYTSRILLKHFSHYDNIFNNSMVFSSDDNACHPSYTGT